VLSVISGHYVTDAVGYESHSFWLEDVVMHDLLAFAVSHPITLTWFATMMFKVGKLSA
jgi:hypothetical protein